MILGTAGHIDHGKTALVYALTGIRTDRLKEERERGISIDLGFAHWDAAPGVRIGIVDVPGHEDFIRNMVAGASGVDAALFVVSAEEGMMPQSREHLDILVQLGVRRGVVALTKSDLVEPDWLALVSDAVAQEVATTFLAEAPRVAVSAKTGSGLDELRAALLALADAAPPRPPRDGFRLPVDRSFTVKGVGTVVTGTPWSGGVRLDEAVRILPVEQGARVRSIETHGAPAESAGPGRRTALALSGVDRAAVPRGASVVTGEHWRPGRLFQVQVEYAPRGPRQLKSGARVRVLLGTAEVIGRLTVAAGSAPLTPGSRAFGQLRLEEDLVARLGDPFVLRSFSPVETLGGGKILLRSTQRLGPRRLRELAWLHEALLAPAAGDRLLAIVRDRSVRGLSLGEAAFRASVPPDEAAREVARLERTGDVLKEGERLYPREALEEVGRRISAELLAFHERERIRRGIGLGELRERCGAPGPLFERALAATVERGAAVVEHNQVRLSERAESLGERERVWRDALIARFERAGLEPPTPEQAFGEAAVPVKAGREILSLLVEEGRLTRVESSLYFHAASLGTARDTVRRFLLLHPLASVGELKELLGVSRKYLIPLLEHFDREGLTRRTPAGRSLARS